MQVFHQKKNQTIFLQHFDYAAILYLFDIIIRLTVAGNQIICGKRTSNIHLMQIIKTMFRNE